MVEDSKIRDWIQDKLDKGIEPERVKKSLENTGHDPSLVDEVQDPFSEDQSMASETADITEEETAPVDEGAEFNQSLDSKDVSGSEDFEFDDAEEDSSENMVDSGDSWTDLNVPNLKSGIPDVSFPEISRKTGIFGILLLLVVSAAGIFMFSDVSVPELEGVESTVNNVVGPGSDSCPVEASIESATISDGKTWVKVQVSENSEVTVSLMEQGEVKAEKTRRISDVNVLIFDSVADKAVVRPTGCESTDSVSLS